MIKLYLVNENRRCFKGGGTRGARATLLAAWAVMFAGAWVTAVVGAQPVSPATQPSTSGARRWEVHAHGSSERIWLAVTTPAHWAEGDRTFVRERAMQADWKSLQDFPSHLISLADSHGQLIASLEGGEWKRISGDQFASGPPLPGHGEILALAGQGATVWAIGFAEGARPETVSPSTTRGSVALAATTKPALPTTRPEQLQLYQLTGEQWARIAVLPADVRTAHGQELSLVVLKNAPMIAYKDSPNSVAMLRYNIETKAWSGAGSIKSSFTVRKLKLMTARDSLMAWAVGENGVGGFYFPQDASTEGEQTWREQLLSVPPTVNVMDSSATAAGDELHLFIVRPDEEFVEQKYTLGGKELPHSLAELPPPTNSEMTTWKEVMNWGLLGLLMVVTLVTANKGGPVEMVVSADNVELPVASYGLRLAAGLIDLWPAFILEVLAAHHLQNGVKLSQLYTDRFIMQAAYVLTAVYLLHMFIGEAVWGRSIGKLIVGLRVVGMNGQRAPLGSILLRNLMKMVEIGPLLGFPLIVLFFNPLRQRIGDISAGTVVISKAPTIGQRDSLEKE